MKKRKIAVTIALAAVITATPALAACSGDHYSEVKFEAQDTSYAVTSQGGSAVSYGNYVYFINGTRGYDDTEGNANVWGEAVKGGLYRAELKGKAVEKDGLKTFAPTADDKGYEFVYEEKEDYFKKPIDVVTTTKIALKTIGTSGYSQGGIFIYDNAVYFASPNNRKNSTGTVQTTLTDFFMMPLSGGKPTLLYTTKQDTSSSAYAFYKFGDKVYLTVNEGSSIVSVKIDPKKAKADDPQVYEVGATSVYFPVRDTYYNGISTDTPEDFIYFVRNVKDEDKQRSGTVIEAMRPDGSEQFVLSMTGATETIEAVRDGVLFIKTKQMGSDVLKYTNLHDELMQYSPTYKEAQNGKSADEKNAPVHGDMILSSGVTSLYPFRGNSLSNVVYYVGVGSDNMWLYDSTGSMHLIASATGTPQFIRDNYLYYAGSASDYYRVPLFKHMDGFGGEATQLASGTTSAGISCDYAAGYFTYFAEVDQWASGYMYFYKLDGREGAEPIFVGDIAEADQPTEEQIKNITGETD